MFSGVGQFETENYAGKAGHSFKSLKRFGREEHGSIIVFSLFLFVAILMVTGLSVDLMRNEMERSQLQAQLDRAVLAAADREQTLEPEEVVYNYLEVAGLADYIDDISVGQTINDSEVSVDASMELSTIFLNMNGLDTLPVIGSSAAAETIQNVEISLVLDITQSMDSPERIGALRPAAKAFVSDVFDASSGSVTTINLIPMGGHVNPGEVMFDFLGGVHSRLPMNYDESDDFAALELDGLSQGTQFAGLDPNAGDPFVGLHGFDFLRGRGFGRGGFYSRGPGPGNSYTGGNQNGNSGCGFGNGGPSGGGQCGGPQDPDPDDEDDDDVVQDDPDTEAPDEEEEVVDLYPDTNCIEHVDADFETGGFPMNSYAQVPHFDAYDNGGQPNIGFGWCPDDNTTVQYAQTDEDVLHTFIDNMKLFDGTASHVGMKWGVALLDPSLQDAFVELRSHGLVPAAVTGRPASYEDTETVKYVVFMTDGQTTDQWRPNDPASVYNLTNELKYTNRMWRIYQKNEARAHFQSICNVARENGIIVFSIAFNVTDSNARSDIEDCASTSSHYFEADEFNLDEAFDAISREITQLRLIR